MEFISTKNFDSEAEKVVWDAIKQPFKDPVTFAEKVGRDCLDRSPIILGLLQPAHPTIWCI